MRVSFRGEEELEANGKPGTSWGMEDHLLRLEHPTRHLDTLKLPLDNSAGEEHVVKLEMGPLGCPISQWEFLVAYDRERASGSFLQEMLPSHVVVFPCINTWLSSFSSWSSTWYI